MGGDAIEGRVGREDRHDLRHVLVVEPRVLAPDGRPRHDLVAETAQLGGLARVVRQARQGGPEEEDLIRSIRALVVGEEDEALEELLRRLFLT